jgi:hypothetical protein
MRLMLCRRAIGHEVHEIGTSNSLRSASVIPDFQAAETELGELCGHAAVTLFKAGRLRLSPSGRPAGEGSPGNCTTHCGTRRRSQAGQRGNVSPALAACSMTMTAARCG